MLRPNAMLLGRTSRGLSDPMVGTVSTLCTDFTELQ